MKHRILLSMLLALSSGAALQAQGQASSIESYLQKAGDHATIFQGRIEPPFNYNQWTGHPFWSDKDVHEGTICFKGILYPNTNIRYDVYQNLVSVISPVRGLAIVPDQSYIDYFVTEGYRHVRIGDYFMRVLFEGQQMSLVMQRRKLKAPDIVVEMHTLKNLEISDKYYLIPTTALHAPVVDQTQLTEIDNVKDLYNIYPESKKSLKSFSSQNRLKFNKEHRANSLKLCMGELEKLTNGNGGQSQVAESRQQIAASNNYRVSPAPAAAFEERELVTDLPSYRSFSKGSIAQYDAYEEYLADDDSFTGQLEPIREKHILDEVMVTGFQQKVNAVQVGMEKFRPAQLKNIPLALGEADVMKMVQTLPGVKSMGEASSGFNVRGGASDQNLILLNNNTVYNPMHLFGLFSAFNSDVIGDTELYKSGIPSQYGGRISSVMNITSKIADRQQWHGSASIGLLTSKATLEAPIVKDKVSLLLGGRTTYSDWMLKMIPEKSGYKDGTAGFWDLSGTLAINFSRNHRLNLYGYYSNDRFAFSPYNKYGYTNGNGSFELKSRYNDRVSSTITAASIYTRSCRYSSTVSEKVGSFSGSFFLLFKSDINPLLPAKIRLLL